jgi:hypothetical protein
MDMVKVNGKDVMVVEYKDKRVLTTEQLADGFECDTYQIRQNYSNNADRFTEGVHFYKLEGEELKQFKASLGESKISTNLKFVPSLMLWTKRGAARHSKMLGTDKAWDMFDCLEENYFNPPHKAMTEAEIVAANAIRLVEQERELKAIRAKQEAQEEALQSMRDVITITHESWRKETTALLNKIAQKRGDDYMTVRHESYVALNERMGVSVEIRLKNARDRMIENGYSKSRINQLNVLDIIEQDKKLVEGYLAVVKDMAIKYGVA